MSKKNVMRKRNKTLAFRLSNDEYNLIQAKIKISGMNKGQFILNSLINQNITISGGKFQSDRLAIELNKLSCSLENTKTTDGTLIVLKECKSLLEQLYNITEYNNKLR